MTPRLPAVTPRQVETALVATVDADTLLMSTSLQRLVARLLLSPADTVAVAGAVFVRNSRRNFITCAQEWDYFLGIASVKRQQGLFQGTMVAQGAFSVYRTAALNEVGGWPDRIGEDIVLTWAMMRDGGRVGYERTAIAFTGAPENAKAFARQRRRWARGMIEGLREHGGALLKGGRTNAHAVVVNFVFPFIDIVYSIAFPIGIMLALTGNFAIVGPMTLAVLPLNLLLSGIVFHLSKQSFDEVDLKVRQNRLGFLGYLLTYQLFMSPVSVAGYAGVVRHHPPLVVRCPFTSERYNRRHRLQPLTAFFNSAPGLNFAAVFAAIWIDSPVCGLRPSRAGRAAVENLPKPVNLTSLPAAS